MNENVVTVMNNKSALKPPSIKTPLWWRVKLFFKAHMFGKRWVSEREARTLYALVSLPEYSPRSAFLQAHQTYVMQDSHWPDSWHKNKSLFGKNHSINIDLTSVSFRNGQFHYHFTLSDW